MLWLLGQWQIALRRNGEAMHIYRPSPGAREVLRFVWADDGHSGESTICC